MTPRLKTAGLAALVLAGLCWLAETLFYGGTDADGALQESFFLPLTFIFAALGIALLAVSLVLDRRR
ncbi:DUF3955 domain-containing protein [Roseobacteraceae bacterium NS-SX3]